MRAAVDKLAVKPIDLRPLHRDVPTDAFQLGLQARQTRHFSSGFLRRSQISRKRR